MPGILTLTTDFGFGPHAGATKGVILSRVPDAQIIDISHDISPQSVVEAAFVLAACAFDFPNGTVHLAVVDPGVGTARRILLVQCDGHVFLAPDNGLLTLVLQKGRKARAWSVENEAFFRKPVSPTFHGRDIFAPVAAAVLCGTKVDSFGPEAPEESIIRLPLPRPNEIADGILGDVAFIDRFGNVITNIDGDMLAKLAPPDGLEFMCGGQTIKGMKRTYSDVKTGQFLAYIGSFGHLEIAVSGGNAQKKASISAGAQIVVKRA